MEVVKKMGASMKVRRDYKRFTPATIILETADELRAVLNMLRNYEGSEPFRNYRDKLHKQLDELYPEM